MCVAVCLFQLKILLLSQAIISLLLLRLWLRRSTQHTGNVKLHTDSESLVLGHNFIFLFIYFLVTQQKYQIHNILLLQQEPLVADLWNEGKMKMRLISIFTSAKELM